MNIGDLDLFTTSILDQPRPQKGPQLTTVKIFAVAVFTGERTRLISQGIGFASAQFWFVLKKTKVSLVAFPSVQMPVIAQVTASFAHALVN